MGQVSFNPVTEWFKNLFKPKNQTPTTQPQSPTANQSVQISGVSVPVSNGYNPYQVQTGDTFESIAANNNTTVPQIQAANNGMAVAPPKGSFLTLPNQAITGNYTVPSNQTGPTVANAQNIPQSTVPTGSFSAGGQYTGNTSETSAHISQQLQNGNLPASISFQAAKGVINPATGRPFTDADYRASGYTYNNQTQQWELGGATQASNQPADQTANQPAYLQTVNYNGRSMPAWEAELRMRRAARKARERAAAVVPTAEATNAGSLPATTLDVQIGGG